jgi:ABC-2 type transport system ATP-binding protein
MDEAQVLCDEIAIMDAGRIVAQGEPDTLLRERYSGLIVELPLDNLHSPLEGIEHTVLDNLGIAEVVTRDVSATLDAVRPHLEDINRIKIRQANLEDLFLDLTGHSLRS